MDLFNFFNGELNKKNFIFKQGYFKIRKKTFLCVWLSTTIKI